jgi:hypothetical protein
MQEVVDVESITSTATDCGGERVLHTSGRQFDTVRARQCLWFQDGERFTRRLPCGSHSRRRWVRYIDPSLLSALWIVASEIAP